MPQLGLTMEEGSVVAWKKLVGDRVTRGEVLFSVETDKTEMEVESADSGYLNSLCVKLGEKVKVGTVIALLGDQPGEVAINGAAAVTTHTSAVDAATSPADPPARPDDLVDSRKEDPSAPEQTSPEIAASPRARRLAKELGIDIKGVKPARGNRVVEEDVRHFYESMQS
ncbi:MAG: E3 binding domain-containing protein [Acidobacteriota bacterium]|nr:E3 binding domain-containing protein [Acidobacteriota bacterium]